MDGNLANAGAVEGADRRSATVAANPVDYEPWKFQRQVHRARDTEGGEAGHWTERVKRATDRTSIASVYPSS